jgi:hypothetical protein
MAFAQLPFASSAYCMIVMRHSEYTHVYFTCNKNNPSTLKQYYFFLRTAFNNKQEFEISHGFGTAQKKLLTVPDRSTE